LEAAGLELSEQDRAAESTLVMPWGELHHLLSHPPPTTECSIPRFPALGTRRPLWNLGTWESPQQGRPRHPPLAPRGWVRRAGQDIIFDFCSPSYLQASIMGFPCRRSSTVWLQILILRIRADGGATGVLVRATNRSESNASRTVLGLQ
jgi:hypothetical protein